MQLKTKAVEAIFYMELSGMIEKKIIRKQDTTLGRKR